MTDREALDFLAYKMGLRFSRVAEALGVSPQVVGNWRKRERISPDKRPAVWKLANTHGAGLPVDWLMERAA